MQERLAREGSGFVWLALSDPEPDDLDEVGASFDLPVLAVEDDAGGSPACQAGGLRGGCVPGRQVDALRPGHGADRGRGDRHVPRVLHYADRDQLVESAPLVGARERLDGHPEVAELGPMAAAWALLDAVIGDNELVIDRMGDLLDRTEQAVFRGDRDQSEPIYLQHRNTERLDRAVHPMLAIFDTLEHGEPVESPEGLQPHLRDVGNHARRLSEEVVRLGNALDGLLDANVGAGHLSPERDHPASVQLGRDRRRAHDHHRDLRHELPPHA